MFSYKKNKWRLWEIDFLRGIAVVLMIFYHILWSLDFFSIQKINLNEIHWIILQRIIAGTFIILVGISLTLSYSKSKKTNFKKYLFRGLKIISYGLIISIASFLLLNHGFVVFGILHFIGFSVILSHLFIRFKEENLFIGLLFIISHFLIKNITTKIKYLIWLGITFPNFYTIDYFPIIPWFGLVLIGIYIGKKVFPRGKRKMKIKQKPHHIFKPFCFLGRHSLKIYFIHAIIIYFLLYIIKNLFLF